MRLPFVRRGQPITAALWEQLVAGIRSVRLRRGPGVRLRETTLGTVVSARRAGTAWAHPFKVTLEGETAAQIRPGLLNGLEPRIGQAKLSDTPAPVLRWDDLKLDPDGRGYVALEFRCDEKWRPIAEELKPVQVAYFDSEDGKKPLPGAGGPAALGGIPGLIERRVRYPLARLVRRPDGRIDLLQICHFNLNHRAHPRPDAGKDVARHFFWAA